MPTTFFLADAESGAMVPPWETWGVVSDATNPDPVNSTTLAKNGTRSFKYEITDATIEGHYSQTLTGSPQVSMGSPNGRYRSGYYSFWAYIDDGYVGSTAWNMLLGWMTGVGGSPNPICHIGLEVWSGVLQLIFYLKNSALYTPPTIAGYVNGGGPEYRMTASSPNGITPFPTGQWVHVGIHYEMAPTNGRVTIWQDGVLIMDLTAPTMNTRDGFTTGSNTAGDMLLQMGIYGGTRADGTQRLYLDDFKVTDFQVVPEDVGSTPVVPDNVALVTAAGGVPGTTPYVDDAQSVGTVKMYSARAIDGLGAVSAWGPWEPMTAEAGTPDAIGCVLPSASGRASQVGALGTLVLQEVDPQRRIFTRNFRHRTGSGGPWSTWAAATSLPATDQVVLDAVGGVVEWSVCYIACDGTMQRLTGSATFQPAGTDGPPPSAGQRTTDVVNFVAGADLIRVQAPPADLTEIDPDWREWKDASGAVRARGSGRVYAPGNTGLEVVFQYSLDGGTSFAPLGVGEDAGYLADGTTDDPDDPKGDFITLAGAARTDILTGVFTRGGDADVATILKLGNQKLEFEQLGAGEPDPGGGGDPQTDPDDDPTDPVDPCIKGQVLASAYADTAALLADMTVVDNGVLTASAEIVLEGGLPAIKLDMEVPGPLLPVTGEFYLQRLFGDGLLEAGKDYYATALVKITTPNNQVANSGLDLEGNGNFHNWTGDTPDTWITISSQVVPGPVDGTLLIKFGNFSAPNGEQFHHTIAFIRAITLWEDGC